MPKKVRARFQVTRETRTAQYSGKTIQLNAVYSSDPVHENKKFWEATPAGELTMTISVPETAAFFVLGQEYDLGFSVAGERG